MFDLDGQIEAWRKSLPVDFANGTDAVDELESHLRDHIDQLVREGKSQKQAWGIARVQLGDRRKLAEEFSKSRAPYWLPVRISAAMYAAGALIMAAAMLVRLSHGRLGPLLGAHVFTLTSGYFAVLATGLSAMIATASRASGRFGRLQSDDFRRLGSILTAAAACLTFLGIILGNIWASSHHPNAWRRDPRMIGALCVLGWSCATLWSFKRQNALRSLGAAIVGNIVVATAWLGPLALENHPAWCGPALAAFVFVQVACLVMNSSKEVVL